MLSDRSCVFIVVSPLVNLPLVSDVLGIKQCRDGLSVGKHECINASLLDLIKVMLS
jgi:hypothetical protein